MRRSVAAAVALVGVMGCGEGKGGEGGPSAKDAPRAAAGVADPLIARTESRPATAFTGIETDGSWEVRWSPAKEPKIEVSGEGAVVPLVTTRIEGERLVISSKGSITSRGPITVTVGSPGLTSVVSRGSGHVTATGFGQDRLRVELVGSGKATLGGRVTALTIVLAGSGDLDADRVDAERVEVAARGSGRATIRATQVAKVELAGSGDVIVLGDPPTLEQKVLGSGSIERR